MTTPTSGSYILAEPIDNPGADGRRSFNDWTKAAQLPAGRYFVNVYTEEEEIAGVTLTKDNIMIHRGRRDSHHLMCARVNGRPARPAPAADALLEALVHEDTMAGVLRYSEATRYTDLGDVLMQLLADGTVKRGDVEHALEIVEARDEAEED